jgi:hypothetical protein
MHAMQQEPASPLALIHLPPHPTRLAASACPQEPAALAEPGRPRLRCRCSVPTHTTLAEGTDCAGAAAQMAAAGLHYPLLAKPLWADGREGSHALAGAPQHHAHSVHAIMHAIFGTPASRLVMMSGEVTALLGPRPCGTAPPCPRLARAPAMVHTPRGPAAPCPCLAHAPAVVHTPRGLQRLVAGEARFLQLPVLLQQYVDHGGCLFKVYVLGDASGGWAGGRAGGWVGARADGWVDGWVKTTGPNAWAL